MPRPAYEDVAQAVRELAERVARNNAPRMERYRVASTTPLRLDGLDSDQVLDERDDDVVLLGDGFDVGDVVAVMHEGGEYVVTAPGKAGGGGGGGGGNIDGGFPASVYGGIPVIDGNGI